VVGGSDGDVQELGIIHHPFGINIYDVVWVLERHSHQWSSRKMLIYSVFSYRVDDRSVVMTNGTIAETLIILSNGIAMISCVQWSYFHVHLLSRSAPLILMLQGITFLIIIISV
jgi:hypothetical protein